MGVCFIDFWQTHRLGAISIKFSCRISQLVCHQNSTGTFVRQKLLNLWNSGVQSIVVEALVWKQYKTTKKRKNVNDDDVTACRHRTWQWNGNRRLSESCSSIRLAGKERTSCTTQAYKINRSVRVTCDNTPENNGSAEHDMRPTDRPIRWLYEITKRTRFHFSHRLHFVSAAEQDISMYDNNLAFGYVCEPQKG